MPENSSLPLLFYVDYLFAILLCELIPSNLFVSCLIARALVGNMSQCLHYMDQCVRGSVLLVVGDSAVVMAMQGDGRARTLASGKDYRAWECLSSGRVNWKERFALSTFLSQTVVFPIHMNVESEEVVGLTLTKWAKVINLVRWLLLLRVERLFGENPWLWPLLLTWLLFRLLMVDPLNALGISCFVIWPE